MREKVIARTCGQLLGMHYRVCVSFCNFCISLQEAGALAVVMYDTTEPRLLQRLPYFRLELPCMLRIVCQHSGLT